MSDVVPYVLPFLTLFLGAALYHIYAVARDESRRKRHAKNLLIQVTCELVLSQQTIDFVEPSKVEDIDIDWHHFLLTPNLPRCDACAALLEDSDVLDLFNANFVAGVATYHNLIRHLEMLSSHAYKLQSVDTKATKMIESIVHGARTTWARLPKNCEELLKLVRENSKRIGRPWYHWLPPRMRLFIILAKIHVRENLGLDRRPRRKPKPD